MSVNLAAVPDVTFEKVTEPKKQDDVLTCFPADEHGRLDGAFTRAILCRNELNSSGSSSSTPTGQRISLDWNCKAEIKKLECSRGGTEFGWQVIAVPKIKL